MTRQTIFCLSTKLHKKTYNRKVFKALCAPNMLEFQIWSLIMCTKKEKKEKKRGKQKQ